MFLRKRAKYTVISPSKSNARQTIMFQCTNLAVQWDPTAKGTCWTKQTIQALGYTNAVCNIITDLLLAVIIPVSTTAIRFKALLI